MSQGPLLPDWEDLPDSVQMEGSAPQQHAAFRHVRANRMQQAGAAAFLVLSGKDTPQAVTPVTEAEEHPSVIVLPSCSSDEDEEEPRVDREQSLCVDREPPPCVHREPLLSEDREPLLSEDREPSLSEDQEQSPRVDRKPPLRCGSGATAARGSEPPMRVDSDEQERLRNTTPCSFLGLALPSSAPAQAAMSGGAGGRKSHRTGPLFLEQEQLRKKSLRSFLGMALPKPSRCEWQHAASPRAAVWPHAAPPRTALQGRRQRASSAPMEPHFLPSAMAEDADIVLARGFVTDASRLIGAGGHRINALRRQYYEVTIQLTNGDRRELVLRGPRRLVEDLTHTLHQHFGLTIRPPPRGGGWRQQCKG
jgi:hypothetical protein